MGVLLKEESEATAKGQIIVPEAEKSADSVIGHFLEFLAQDMAKHPDESIVPFPNSLMNRAFALTAEMGVDLDAEIEGGVSI